jgi:uncharacterized protein YndB with AHSA1/START domain
MPTAADTYTIDAAPERVWDMLTALRYAHLWLADVTGVREISTADVGEGTTFDLLRALSAKTTWVVNTWQPVQHVGFSTLDGDTHYRFTLEPTDTGTQLTMEYQKTARGLGRLLPAAAQRRLVQSSLARLKELIVFNRDIALIHGVGDE